MQSNTLIKIIDIINNYEQHWTKERAKEFRAGHAKSYSSLKNYSKGENLEWGLRKDGIAYQKAYPNPKEPKFKIYPHDIIIPPFDDILIDLKLKDKNTGNISISKPEEKKIQYAAGQVTHYCSYTYSIDEINDKFTYKVDEIVPCDEVFNNLFGGGDGYKLYRPKKMCTNEQKHGIIELEEVNKLFEGV